MSTIVFEERIRIPEIDGLEAFRRWTRSEAFPQRGRFSHLNGELWVDLMPEQLFTHNQVKGEYGIVVGGLLKKLRRGRYFHDRTLLTHIDAGLSTEPDGTFVSFASLRLGRLRGARGSSSSKARPIWCWKSSGPI